MATTRVPTFEVGQKVAYSIQFLRSTGMSHTALAHARGTVLSVKPFSIDRQIVEIDWNDPDVPTRVNSANLALVGANRRFANVD